MEGGWRAAGARGVYSPIVTPSAKPQLRAAVLLCLLGGACALLGERRPLVTPAARSALAPAEPAYAAGVGAASPSSEVAAAATPAVPVPPRSVAEALASMRLAEGFEVQCVASEPVVEAPVAMAFDPDGRLYVVEMRSYMPDVMGTDEKLPTNRISVLEDTDGDGTFDSSRVFLDDLVLPRGVAPCFGGALVIEPPYLYFCKDTDGDGRADVKTRLLDGFLGVENPEHAGNGLLPGLDNWYHLSQHHLEFRFDGQKVETRPTPAHGQWGITMDDAGRLYYTPNSTPLLMDAFPKHLASLNPELPNVAGIAENIAQPASATFPIHATLGVNRGYQDGILRSDGTLANLTAACSPVIYRASLLGESVRNDAFICEPAGQIVKRISLGAGGPTPRGTNAYSDSEFLASDDERFRPVSACVGPDGALYIADMYRGVIQHKTYLTDYLKAQIKKRLLEGPVNMGRIYRITPKGWTPRPAPRLSSLAPELLTEVLSHPDGWYRDTAQRLIVQGKLPVASVVRVMFAESPEWTTRLHALRTLEGLGEVNAADINKGAADSNDFVAAAAVLLWPRFPGAIDPDVAIARAQRSATPGLRVATAHSVLSVGKGEPHHYAAAVAEALTDAPSQDALILASRGAEAAVLRRLCATLTWPADQPQRRLLQRLCQCLLARDAASRSELVELCGDASLSEHQRTVLEESVLAAMRLKDDEPRVLVLAREPKAWMNQQGDKAQQMLAAAVYFDWPQRPAINRPRVMKELTADQRALFRKGELLFATCAGCHQGQGQGSPGQAATLAGSSILNGPADRAIRAIVHGLQGSYTVGDAVFNGLMPPTKYETDDEYAAVLTYARRSFGNRGTPVTAAEVSKVKAAHRDRKTPWTREELLGK